MGLEDCLVFVIRGKDNEILASAKGTHLNSVDIFKEEFPEIYFLVNYVDGNFYCKNMDHVKRFLELYGKFHYKTMNDFESSQFKMMKDLKMEGCMDYGYFIKDGDIVLRNPNSITEAITDRDRLIARVLIGGKLFDAAGKKYKKRSRGWMKK